MKKKLSKQTLFVAIIPGIVCLICILQFSIYRLKPLSQAEDSPEISTFAPTSTLKDSIVIITGSNFSYTSSKNLVTINGVPAVVSAATPTALAIKVPLHAGTGKIAVTTPNGSDTSATEFICIP